MVCLSAPSPRFPGQASAVVWNSPPAPGGTMQPSSHDEWRVRRIGSARKLHRDPDDARLVRLYAQHVTPGCESEGGYMERCGEGTERPFVTMPDKAQV